MVAVVVSRMDLSVSELRKELLFVNKKKQKNFGNLGLRQFQPYAPKLNSVENIWQYLRGNKFDHEIWETCDAIVDACCNAWNSIIKAPGLIKSIATKDGAEVKI